LITLLRVVACTVGVPSSLKVLRFMIGTTATSGRSPSISRARSSQRMSMSSCFRSATVPTVSSLLEDHGVLNSTKPRPITRISICCRR